jgi:hypothetical protein
MAIATAMYHTEKNPLKRVLRGGAAAPVTKAGRMRRLHKAFLRYHDPENWPMLREALQDLGRADLIGNGKQHLIPSFQPAGTGLGYKPRQEAPAVAKTHAKPAPRTVAKSMPGGRERKAEGRGKPAPFGEVPRGPGLSGRRSRGRKPTGR